MGIKEISASKPTKNPLYLTGYKGFAKGLICKDLQYKEGEFTEGSFSENNPIVLCKRGFHFCLNPLDVLRYYCGTVRTEELATPSLPVVYAKVTGYECAHSHKDDTKRVCSKLYVDKTLTTRDFIESIISSGSKSSVRLVKNHCYNQSTNSKQVVANLISASHNSVGHAFHYDNVVVMYGTESIAITEEAGNIAACLGELGLSYARGYNSTAYTSAKESIAITHNPYSFAETKGYNSIGLTKGSYSTVSVGESSFGFGLGKYSSAQGDLHSWLTLTEWSDATPYPTHMKSVFVDGKKILPNVLYMLKNNRVVRADRVKKKEKDGK